MALRKCVVPIARAATEDGSRRERLELDSVHSQEAAEGVVRRAFKVALTPLVTSGVVRDLLKDKTADVPGMERFSRTESVLVPRNDE
jgi:hypothetical protein